MAGDNNRVEINWNKMLKCNKLRIFCVSLVARISKIHSQATDPNGVVISTKIINDVVRKVS
jgi:hypothetical protein